MDPNVIDTLEKAYELLIERKVDYYIRLSDLRRMVIGSYNQNINQDIATSIENELESWRDELLLKVDNICEVDNINTMFNFLMSSIDNDVTNILIIKRLKSK